MIAHIQIESKSFGDKTLYNNLEIRFAADEKVGLIGRNGTGKSTLLNIIAGDDTDFEGEVYLRKNLVLVSSRQEHHNHDNNIVIDYITNDLPEYSRLKHIIDTYPDKMTDKNSLIQKYCDALDRFSQLGYFEIEQDIISALESYQIDKNLANKNLGNLSGGQKRLAELVKVQRARADIALIDEPTNHMDYISKQSFIDWMNKTKGTVVAITHDRDVLGAVDRIIEIRNGKAYEYNGNYDSYLKINATKITSEVNEYTIIQRRVSNLEESVVRFRRFKEKARDPGTIAGFKRRELQAKKELTQLQSHEKPSFWIDQESVTTLKSKIANAYDKHKSKNITIRTKNKTSRTQTKLITVHDISLGYENPLFKDISFTLSEGEKIQLKGRNGVGKTTLLNAILATSKNTKPASKIFNGHIECDKTALFGVYEQEISPDLLKYTLEDAIYKVYELKKITCTVQLNKQLMSDYLFNPIGDGSMLVADLSGGQKARLQLISMLAGDPNILILDEPTNHLDLPSVEELEYALSKYHGAIIYISHDSYFTNKIGGNEISM